MTYGAAREEITEMAKQGMEMSEAEVDAFIMKNRDDERKTWVEIASRLKMMGYKSRRNGKPITPNTVRFRYYNPGKATLANSSTGAIRGAARESGSTAERQAELIRATLKMKLEPGHKLAIIQQILDQG